MKNILIALCAALALSACSTVKAPNKPNKIKARVTYYNAHEDKWGARVAMSPKMRACEGVTVAAHPSFHFGTQIMIPTLKGVLGSGVFMVQDRGTDVTRRKASNGNEFVFDVFLSGCARRLNSFANKMPPYMDVIVLNKG